MSWIELELACSRYSRNQPYHVDFEWTEFRELIDLRWFLGPLDELLNEEGLGAKIDDCLVESAGGMLSALEQGLVDTHSFREFLDQAAKGILEDNAVRAFRLSRSGDVEQALASEIYLDLIRRHTLDGGKSCPSLHGVCLFVRTFLGQFIENKSWDVDWDIREYSRLIADHWWINPRAVDHFTLIRDSFFSAAAWDALKLICADAFERGWVNRLPHSIHSWYMHASHGYPRRPEEGPAKPNRPDKYGTKLRNNEVKHTVELLELAGLPRAVGVKAISMELNYAEPTVRRICRKPYTSLEELRRDGQKRFEPALYSLSHGSESTAGPTG